jgi:hypothetical protein
VRGRSSRETVAGGLHQVAMHSSDVTCAPSDPTIE